MEIAEKSALMHIKSFCQNIIDKHMRSTTYDLRAIIQYIDNTITTDYYVLDAINKRVFAIYHFDDAHLYNSFMSSHNDCAIKLTRADAQKYSNILDVPIVHK